MPLPGCKLTYLVEPPTAFIKIAGRAAVEGAREFKGLIERLHGEGIPQFCLDLSECLLMDSTFSGVLAGLATRFGNKTLAGGFRFVLANPNERVRDLLDSLGVLALMPVVNSGAAGMGTGTIVEHVGQGSSREEVAECCLEAHRLLMTLNEANRGRFLPVVEMLRSQGANTAT